MKQLLLFFTILLLAGACKQHHATNVKQDIPTLLGGSYDIYYEQAKLRQLQLGLDTMENGFRDLQIRIWYNHSLTKSRQLVVLKFSDSTRTATIYNLQVNGTGDAEKIQSKTTREAMPASGWDTFYQKLLSLGITQLPNQDDVEGYSAGDDGTTYSIETATPDTYRFYNYWEPNKNKDRFPEAKKMSDILTLVETELSIQPQ